MDLSIVIPTYKRPDLLGATLWSLIRQESVAARYEILVVDNNSQDRTPEVVREIQAHSPIPISYYCETRPGVHYARNSGALRAQGEILYYTDDDMVADPAMLGAFLKLLELDPGIGTATGAVLPKWDCEPPKWIKHYCANHLLSLQERLEDLIISSDFINVFSCHQIVRKHVLLECGGFNPENTGGVWMGDGETGLNIKVRAHKYKFAYTSKAVTYHVIPRERMTQRYLNRRMENQGSSDVFTWYRRVRPDRWQLFRSQIRSLMSCGYRGLKALQNRLLLNEYWRIHYSRIWYHHARFKYMNRLKENSPWREYVLRDDYLDHEEPLKCGSPVS